MVQEGLYIGVGAMKESVLRRAWEDLWREPVHDARCQTGISRCRITCWPSAASFP